MDVIETELPGVLLLALRTFADERGFFVERYHEQRFAQLGLPTEWKQDNHSRSLRGVLRGLHYQLRRPQGKLVSCVRGEIFDVVVDIRTGSPTFGRWAGVTLGEDRQQLLWIPPGFAHGFCATTDVVDIMYKCTEQYVPGDEHGIAWNDPELAIAWPIAAPLLSPRDRALPCLRDARDALPDYRSRIATGLR